MIESGLRICNKTGTDLVHQIVELMVLDQEENKHGQEEGLVIPWEIHPLT
jgi:hypothetical protein